MKHMLVVVLFSLPSAPWTSEQNDWENPTIVEINCEPVRATYTPYRNVERATEMGVSFEANGPWTNTHCPVKNPTTMASC